MLQVLVLDDLTGLDFAVTRFALANGTFVAHSNSAWVIASGNTCPPLALDATTEMSLKVATGALMYRVHS